jgi:hypothetical protein
VNFHAKWRQSYNKAPEINDPTFCGDQNIYMATKLQKIMSPAWNIYLVYIKVHDSNNNNNVCESYM